LSVLDDVLDDIKEDEFVKSHAYKDGQTTSKWDASHWGKIEGTEYNGKGKYFAWKYTLAPSHAISPSNQTGGKTYRRGEVYRFGVRLFDEKGNASSVKWMCDITMPPLF